MNDNILYELTVNETHIKLLLKALDCLTATSYDALDQEVVDVESTIEEVKVMNDIKAVIKYNLGSVLKSPTQTSNHTELIWCKEIDLDEYCNQDMFDQFNDERLQQAWNKVKERHSDTIKQIGDM